MMRKSHDRSPSWQRLKTGIPSAAERPLPGSEFDLADGRNAGAWRSVTICVEWHDDRDSHDDLERFLQFWPSIPQLLWRTSFIVTIKGIATRRPLMTEEMPP